MVSGIYCHLIAHWNFTSHTIVPSPIKCDISHTKCLLKSIMRSMQIVDWVACRYFNPKEAWGEPFRMSYELVMELERFRDFIDTKIHILCGTQGVHSSTSQHYSGLAVDICFPERPLEMLPDAFLASLRFNFKGVGIYPHWQLEDQRLGGLHLDLRDEPIKAMWLCTLDNGKQTYQKMTWRDLNQAMAEAGKPQATSH